MPITYTPIATQTLASNTATVTFSSIPATYTDLVFVFDAATVTAGKTLLLRFNSDSTALYSYTNLDGNGTAAASSRNGASPTSIQIESTNVGTDSNLNASNCIINVMNYSNSTTFKTALCRINNASGASFPGVAQIVGLYRSTTAISSVSITTTTDQQKSGAVFALYGIKAA
jgi:hypothetical protein